MKCEACEAGYRLGTNHIHYWGICRTYVHQVRAERRDAHPIGLTDDQLAQLFDDIKAGADRSAAWDRLSDADHSTLYDLLLDERALRESCPPDRAAPAEPVQPVPHREYDDHPLMPLAERVCREIAAVVHGEPYADIPSMLIERIICRALIEAIGARPLPQQKKTG